jgi:hypothetical protein
MHAAVDAHGPNVVLVAPSDTEASSYPRGPAGWLPIPLTPFSFPSIVVASSDDEYCTVDRAKTFAPAWGSRYVELEAAGHINSVSGLGPWPAGKKLLDDLLN